MAKNDEELTFPCPAHEKGQAAPCGAPVVAGGEFCEYHQMLADDHKDQVMALLFEIVLDAHGLEHLKLVLLMAEAMVVGAPEDLAENQKESLRQVHGFIGELKSRIAAMEAETSQTAPN